MTNILIIFQGMNETGATITGNIAGYVETYPPTISLVREMELAITEKYRIKDVVITNWLPLSEEE